jgi:hypothetical protein
MLPTDLVLEPGSAVEEFLHNIRNATKVAKDSLQRAKTAMKQRCERHRPPPQNFMEGDQVLVTTQHLPSNRPTGKLDQKWRGPFRVIKKVGEVAYKLDLPPTWKGQKVFNEGRIKPFHALTFPNQERMPSRPEPELNSQGLEEYEVREILDQRGVGLRAEYLVRWEGYGPEDDTWEPLRNLENTKGALRAFKAGGRATKGGEHHVTASITEEIRKDRQRGHEPNQDEPSPHTSHREMTQREQDSETRSVSHGSSAELTGKLCRCVMVLIWWKVGADVAVTDRVVWVLEEWLHRR